MSRNNPKYIVIHTAAFDGFHCDVTMIDKWHKKNGWDGIGYHYVITNGKSEIVPDGTIQKGREEDAIGAHTRGLNDKSIGICCAGHGDRDDFTEAQYTSLERLVSSLMDDYGIPANNIIGHREVNILVDKGIISDQYRTNKTCPGTKVSMYIIRERLVSPCMSSIDGQTFTDYSAYVVPPVSYVSYDSNEDFDKKVAMSIIRLLKNGDKSS